MDFYIGRAPAPSCKFTLAEPTVSNLHLRIYVICCQNEDQGNVNPLIYAQNLSRNGTQLRRQRDDADPARSYTTIRLRKGDSAVLLHHEDQLDVGSEWSFMYTLRKAHSSLVAIRASDELRSKEMKDFDHLYTISRRKIGGGEHSQVFLAFDRFRDRQLVCKIVDKGLDGQIPRQVSYQDAQERKQAGVENAANIWADKNFDAKMNKAEVKLIREVDILRNVSHPNIINIEQIFVSETTTYIFQELVAGGDLLSYVELCGGRIPEAETAIIVRQILEALTYLHAHGIVHRDLKPDNILMASLSKGARVLLTDFSSARYFVPDPVQGNQNPLFSQVGAVAYAAPEMFRLGNNTGYSNLVDLWSLGNLTANVLTGDYLLPTIESYITSTANVSEFSEAFRITMKTGVEWRHVSKRAKSFISKLLVNEAERMNAPQALQHEWLTSSLYSEELNAIYKKAIEDWCYRPCHKTIVQIICGRRADIPVFRPPDYMETIRPGQRLSKDKSYLAFNSAHALRDMNS